MTAIRISELAERSGFPATTLRYYEQLGLLPAAPRTANGYRVYGEDALARLEFIDRAKRLGVPLTEIAELVEVWATGDCPPVQTRLAALVETKAREVNEQLAELSTFAADLDRARAHLTGEPAPTCGPDCGCARASDAVLAVRRGTGDVDEVVPTITATAPASGPHTCSLSTGQLATRTAAWAAVMRRATGRVDDPSGSRVTFPASAGVTGQLAELISAERSCCSFLTFTLSWTGPKVVLHVATPPEGKGMLDLLLTAAPKPVPVAPPAD
jgi:DNA-binding transcriptional MerR regulator